MKKGQSENQKKVILEKLKKKKDQFEALFNSIPVPTYVWQRKNKDFILTEYNYEALKISEGKIANSLNIKASKFYKDNQQLLTDLESCYSEKETIVREIPYEFKSTGETKHLAIKSSFIHPNIVLVHTEDITARVEAERLLKINKERLELSLEGSSEGLWDWNIETGEIYYSHRWETMLGYEPREVKGHTQLWEKLVHPDDLDSVMKIWKKHLDGEIELYESEYRFKNKSGEWIWILDKGKIVERDKNRKPLRAVGTHTNITEKVSLRNEMIEYSTHLEDLVKERTNELLRKNKLLKNEIKKRKNIEYTLKKVADEWNRAFDTLSDCVSLLDKCGNIIRCNHALKKILGLTFSEIIGESICELLHKKDINSEDCLFQHMKRAKKREEKILKMDDSWFRCIFEPILEETGEFTGAIHILNDITDRKKAEDESFKQEENLRHADRMISLGILVSGVAHEINNPNNAIILNSSFLKRSFNDIVPILDKYYSKNKALNIGGLNYSEFRYEINGIFSGITRSSNRIKTIVEELKMYSRKNRSIFKSKVNVCLVVKSALNLLKSMVKKSTKNLRVSCKNNLPVIYGNFQNLEQVVINLIQNSCQSLISRDEYISISTSFDERNNDVIIEIKDEGIGIDEKNLKYIIEPFFTTKRNKGGVGLGLSVSSRIISEHGGSIHFSSKPGRGTTVRVLLPVPEDNYGEKNNE